MTTNKIIDILLIGDDKTTNFFITRMLKKLNLSTSIHMVENGKEGIDCLKYQKIGDNTPSKLFQPDFIFLDINMPVMNGWEFLDIYQVHELGKNANIIVLSAFLKKEDREKAKKYGLVKEIIDKPLSLRALKSILAKY